MNVKSDLPTTLCSKVTASGDSACFLPDEHSGSHQWGTAQASLADAIGQPKSRYDRVLAAYDGMDGANQLVFRAIIRDAKEYSHAQVAEALRDIGYDVDRKQVHQFREKLTLGKATL